MPKLRVLSGDDIIAVFHRFKFTVVSQKGSHAKLSRTLPDGCKQTLTIPRHHELDPGTVKAIYRQALKYIPEADLKPRFFTE